MLGTYLPTFLETTFPGLTPQTTFTSFQSIVTYIRLLSGTAGTYSLMPTSTLTNQGNPTVSGHWIINGNVAFANSINLTIPTGYLLFIDGNLTMGRNSTITGNVVINGNLVLGSSTSSTEHIDGTVYVKGTVTFGRRTALGTSIRPSFILSEGNIALARTLSGYGYFVGDAITYTTGGTILFTGGIYPMVSTTLTAAMVQANLSLDQNSFYGFAVPLNVPVLTSTNDLLFQYTGKEATFVVNPVTSPTSLLASYLPNFLETTFSGLTAQTSFSSFQDIVNYILTLSGSPGTYESRPSTTLTSQPNPTVSGHWIISGNVTLGIGINLTIPAGYLLFINGNLTMGRNSTITGNVVINGNLVLGSSTSSTEHIDGTLYVKGTVTFGRRTALGTLARPSFILSEGNIALAMNLSGYGYLFGDVITYTTGGTILFTGGIYPTVSTTVTASMVTANTSLNQASFYGFAIPTELMFLGPGFQHQFTYTTPQ
jgi:predicted acyltransferase (DUF342 family)